MSISKLSLSPLSTPSPQLAHFNRLLATTSGTDKLMMTYAYSAHVIMYILRSKHLATKSRLDIADRIGKLAAVISDARMLYRIFGAFPILGWAQSLNDPATAPKDKRVALLQRLQAWSMLIYYPLEHTYYLASKGVFDIVPSKMKKIAMWSARFWAAYVVLQFAVIHREHTLLARAGVALKAKRAQGIKSEKVDPEALVAEKVEAGRIRKKAAALKTDLLVQIGYLPLTMHWSLPNGLLPEQVYVGACGTLAAVFGFQSVWRATA